MPSDKFPGNESNDTKPLSIEEFQKLKAGDTFWAISNPAGNPDHSMDITPMVIYKFYNLNSVKVSVPKLKFPLDFFTADFLNKYKVFSSEKDAQEELKKQIRLN